MPRHVYVHVPFCARRCSYCDFAIAVRKTVPVEAFVAGIGRELALRFGEGAEAGRERDIETLYLGGGTPSRIGPDGVRRLVDTIRTAWVIAPGAEVTIEANPEDVSEESAHAWREAGINRVSLGVQSFDDRVLSWMHRTHDAAQVALAAAALGSAGFGDWSLDLIFALPPEVQRTWADDLRRAIDLGPSHISCYGLTVEPHTPLVRWRERGIVHDADEDRYEAEFLLTDEALGAAGFEHYEVSNYAKPGRRARHNSSYWQRVPYAGLGPSAHSFDGETRRWNEREYVAWQQAVDIGSDPVGGAEVLTPEDRSLEIAYLGLRTVDGLAVSGPDLERVAVWERHGWAALRDSVVTLTPTGWLRLDALVADLTGLRSRY